MKEKMVYKGNNVVGALMNVPIFVGTRSIVTDFAVLENMDDYCDEGIGDVTFGEPFLREVGIKTRPPAGLAAAADELSPTSYLGPRAIPNLFRGGKVTSGVGILINGASGLVGESMKDGGEGGNSGSDGEGSREVVKSMGRVVDDGGGRYSEKRCNSASDHNV
ncbi:hypothetical protein Tco_0210696 [Tanacetum coccineum]